MLHILTNLTRFFRHPTARAIGLVFAADNLMFGSWLSHIPYVKQNLGLDEAQLGLALFGMPLGLLAMNPFSARLIAYFGLVELVLGVTVVMGVTLTLPVWMPGLWWLFIALFAAGATLAVLNVAVNTCATAVERAEGMHIMSTCHGMWSLGGLLGSALAASLIGWGVSPRWHLVGAGILVAAGTLLWLRRPLYGTPVPSFAADGANAPFAWPNRELLYMVSVGICMGLCEGVAFDWSAVYLTTVLGAPAAQGALAITGFSLTMMLMRFSGDVLIPRYGERRLLYFCSGASAFSILLAAAAVAPWMGLLGFLALGAGVALASPILFNAAARAPGMAPGAGLATYVTFSFLGFLVGPPLVGLAGQQFGLSWAFVGVAVLAGGSAWAVRQLR